MKESVLDILIELFENHFDADLDGAAEPDGDVLKQELERAGFCEREVDRALKWLETLRADPERAGAIPPSRSIRVFDPSEQSRLDVECRGYILYLEGSGVLNAAQRELLIDRLLALDVIEIDLEHVKWVALMVLFSQPGEGNAYLRAYLRMEDLVLDNRLEAVH